MTKEPFLADKQINNEARHKSSARHLPSLSDGSYDYNKHGP